ncbi:hypothetical protein Bca4012_038821 [Brassica carinata]
MFIYCGFLKHTHFHLFFQLRLSMRGKLRSNRGRSMSLSRESKFSAQSSNPSSSHARSTAPRMTSLPPPPQYPPHTQISFPPAQIPYAKLLQLRFKYLKRLQSRFMTHLCFQSAPQPPPVKIPAPQPPPVQIPDAHEPPAENFAAQIQQQYQVMLEDLMALPGPEDLPRLNPTRIPNMNTTWLLDLYFLIKFSY